MSSRRTARKRGAAPRWRAGPVWARVVVAEDMGKRYHAQPKPRVGPAPRGGGGRDREPGRLRLVAERGVAHQRFEAAQRLALLGRASGDEPRSVAEAAEGERQGPQERAGEAFDELDGEPGEVGTGGHEQKARRGGADRRVRGRASDRRRNRGAGDGRALLGHLRGYIPLADDMTRAPVRRGYPEKRTSNAKPREPFELSIYNCQQDRVRAPKRSLDASPQTSTA